MAKLTAAAKKYDKVRGNALTSFEPYALNYTMFAAALAKTFNLTFTPKEMGHLVTLYDPKKTQEIVCKPFLTAFFLLGTTERERMRQAQIAKQREAEHAIRETQEKLKHGLGMVGKVVPPDWTYTEEDRDSALGKMTACAVSYDPNAPSALKLTSFQGLTLTPQAFKEAVRTTFNLVLKVRPYLSLSLSLFSPSPLFLTFNIVLKVRPCSNLLHIHTYHPATTYHARPSSLALSSAAQGACRVIPPLLPAAGRHRDRLERVPARVPAVGRVGAAPHAQGEGGEAAAGERGAGGGGEAQVAGQRDALGHQGRDGLHRRGALCVYMWGSVRRACKA